MLISLRSPGEAEGRLMEVTPGGLWKAATRGSAPDLGHGLWATNGLADAHAHLAATAERDHGDPVGIRERAFACLRRGAFLIVDKGWSDTTVVATLSSVPPEERPDWEAAGHMIAVPGGYYPDFAIEVDPGDLADVVADGVASGRGWVKLVGDWPRKGRGALANFSEDDLRDAVEVAHRGGARVSIHTMAPDVPSVAVRAGVDSIEHGLFLSQSDLEMLGERHGAWVPTVLRMEQTAEMLGSDSTGGRLIRDGLDNVASLLSSVPEGVAVLAGSDMAIAPGDVGPEVVRLMDLGLEPQRAVEAATTAAFEYLSRPTGFNPGRPADAVFFAQDPLQNPNALLNPVAVMRSGKLIR